MQCNRSYASHASINFIIAGTESNSDEVGPITTFNHDSDDHCYWRRQPPSMGIFMIYAFVVPTFAIFGLCANFINAIVFMRPKMTPSAFTYLAALSWLDCLSCLFITLTAFSRSIFFHSTTWLVYDFLWQTPLFGITTGAANLILACVSLDRLIYLWNVIPNGKPPSFCRRIMARRMIFFIIIVSCFVNIPYFFVFVVHNDGTFELTHFYYSHYYKIHNWLTFILLAVLPAIFLLIGNGAILYAFRRWTKQSKKCQKLCSNGNTSCSKTTQKRYQHQMKLTITILIVITLYLIGELPAHLTSRKSALNLLYSGDMTKVNFKAMERLEVICITLNSLQLSMNIMIYAVINPSFMPEFFVCLRGASDACFRYLGILACVRYIHKSFKGCVFWRNSKKTKDDPTADNDSMNRTNSLNRTNNSDRVCSKTNNLPESRDIVTLNSGSDSAIDSISSITQNQPPMLSNVNDGDPYGSQYNDKSLTSSCANKNFSEDVLSELQIYI